MSLSCLHEAIPKMLQPRFGHFTDTFVAKIFLLGYYVVTILCHSNV